MEPAFASFLVEKKVVFVFLNFSLWFWNHWTTTTTKKLVYGYLAFSKVSWYSWGCYYHSFPGGPGGTIQGKWVKASPAGSQYAGQRPFSWINYIWILCISSSQLWNDSRNFTIHWEPHVSAANVRSLSNRHALRERRGWGRIGLGSYSSFWKVKDTSLSWVGFWWLQLAASWRAV